MENTNSGDTNINFEDVAKRRITNYVNDKISEAMLQIISSEDMLIASTLVADVESLIEEVATQKIKDLLKGG